MADPSPSNPQKRRRRPRRKGPGTPPPPPADVGATGLFLATQPGLEAELAAEARALGLSDVVAEAGGVSCAGDLTTAMRANLWLRTATQVLLRIAVFRAAHPAQLDKRARRVDWARHISADVPVRVEATCRKSRVYHAGAAQTRVAAAITDATGAVVADDATLRVLVRIEDDLATISLDTSGAPLHKRGTKQAVGKAPLRETMAAAFLARMGFDGQTRVIDPMCGSGTFVLEAAEIAAGRAPGRARGFAFEDLASFDPAAWAALRAELPPPREGGALHLGFDRDAGAVAMARANAERAGLSEACAFEAQPISALVRPDGAPGLVMVNPPYGARIGDRRALFSLYNALGETVRAGFRGWRVGLVTSDGGLARATGLPFVPGGPSVSHGGLSVTLYQTGPLPG